MRDPQTTPGAPRAEDAAPGDGPARLLDALERFQVRPALSGEDFDASYAFLEPEFGPRNELERKPILERWFSSDRVEVEEGFRCHYDLAMVEDRDGRLVAVRDCYTAVLPAERLAVVLLSHALVVPDQRRSGVAAILRALPFSWARARAGRASVDECVLVAEMEPILAGTGASIVRHLAYRRAGFRIVPPWLLPYAQVDFRDTAALGVEPCPVPMMWVLRHLGMDGLPAAPGGLPRRTAEATLRAIHAFHRPAVEARQIPMLEGHILGAGGGLDPLPYHDLDPANPRSFEPILAVRLRTLYPSEWWPIDVWPDEWSECARLEQFLGAGA